MPNFLKSKFLWSGITLAFIVVGAIIWVAQASPPLETQFKTETLSAGDVTQTVSANGTLNPVVLVNVGTQVSGTVKILHADFNDHVKQGQALLELDPALLQAQVHVSEANVTSAENALAFAAITEERRHRLLDEDSIAKQDYDDALQALRAARAQLQQTRAQLQKDRINLGYTTIRSPVSGVVVDRQVDIGQTVAASFQTPTLFRIAQDLRKMQIDSSFAEADIGNIKVDQRVRFNVDAFASRNFEGRVRQIRLNPTVQQNVVTYDVVVAVDNPDQILMPGMTAFVNIIIAERKHALLVPNAALRFKPRAGTAVAAAKREAGQGVVYVLDQKQLRPVSIKTGIADSHYTEIISGDLKVGDPVVVEDLRAVVPQATNAPRVRMF